MIVIPIDPFQGLPFDLAHGFSQADLVDDLGFEQADDTFSKSIVIGVAHGSDGRVYADFDEPFSIFDRQILCEVVPENWTVS